LIETVAGSRWRTATLRPKQEVGRLIEDHEDPHGHFSEGQEKTPEHTPDKEHFGHFSEGQEKEHGAGPRPHGHFSEGQEKTSEHTPDEEHVGQFSEGQERRPERG
jgi:hypothetical protein